MLKTATWLALVGIVAAEPHDFARIAKVVNSMDTTWTATESPQRFEGAELAQIKALCGTWLPGHPQYNASLNPPALLGAPVADDLPESFDWRKQAPQCKSVMQVRDQSACGSCWAFSASDTFSDRRCIKLGDEKVYSPLDTVSCCKFDELCGMSMGCNGGMPGSALGWMSRRGIVTGDLYDTIGSGSSCKPYTMSPCAHHTKPTKKYPVCPPEGTYKTPRCVAKCSEATYNVSFQDDKTRGKGAYSVHGEKQIMTDLMKNGPLSVAFSVYEDLPAYTGGVYQHRTGEFLGGHAVQMMGWGVDGTTPYWWIKNSWNPMWGDKGYFKILRGKNECGIEGQVHGIHIE